MNRTTIISFVSTLALVLPAAWHSLDADAEHDGVRARPPLAELTIDGTKIELSADRAQVAPGGEVHVKLVASADQKRESDVEVQVLERTGSRMSRVSTPPITIATRQVHLVAVPGGGPAQSLAFTLKGSGGADPVAIAGHATDYTILVKATGGSAQAAAVTVVTYVPEAYSITIEPRGKLELDKTETFVVHVKNTSKKTLRNIAVNVWASDIEFSAMPPAIAKLAPGREALLVVEGMVHGEHFLDTTKIVVSAGAAYGGTTGATLTIDPNGKVVAEANGPAASQGNVL